MSNPNWCLLCQRGGVRIKYCVRVVRYIVLASTIVSELSAGWYQFFKDVTLQPKIFVDLFSIDVLCRKTF